ncbi:unnamed protein product [Allacma fusca]|uniref:Uncharacterized protein n=1 Tax=Allacma fusca TaxID=39272 RepID=A0A8J2KMT0_9HEXA|nr:unnamed protein product [Allacma fusca]
MFDNRGLVPLYLITCIILITNFSFKF